MKKIIASFIAGAIMATAISANAEEVISMIGRKIEGQFVVKLNDKQIENQAIVVDGTSYLPVRAIGEALNLEVGFNADLGITLKNKPNQVTGSASAMPVEQIDQAQEIVLINNKIKELKATVQGATFSIAAAELNLQNPDNPNKEVLNQKISEFKTMKSDAERQITELEAQKAQLEAQVGTP